MSGQLPKQLQRGSGGTAMKADILKQLEKRVDGMMASKVSEVARSAQAAQSAAQEAMEAYQMATEVLEAVKQSMDALEKAEERAKRDLKESQRTYQAISTQLRSAKQVLADLHRRGK